MVKVEFPARLWDSIRSELKAKAESLSLKAAPSAIFKSNFATWLTKSLFVEKLKLKGRVVKGLVNHFDMFIDIVI